MVNALFGALAVTIAHYVRAISIFVDPSATGEENGSSWLDASTRLQTAILAAKASGDAEVLFYLRGGRQFFPEARTAADDCFVFPSGSEVYGGFYGDDSDPLSRPQLGDSDYDDYASTISGTIMAQTRATYCYHVITFPTTFVLDQVTVKRGSATGDAAIDPYRVYGGGMIAENPGSAANVVLNDVTFENLEAEQGAAIWIGSATQGNDEDDSVDLAIANCRFIGNDASSKGGAIYINRNSASTLSITGTVFDDNSASDAGGAIYHEGGVNIEMIDSTIMSNRCENSNCKGGAIYGDDESGGNAMLSIAGCDFQENIADSAGGAISWANGVECELIDNEFNDNLVLDPSGMGSAIALFGGASIVISDPDNNVYGSEDSVYQEEVSSEVSKPNILVFFIDDFQYTSKWATEYYGAPETQTNDGDSIATYYDIDTPYLDALIEESVSFTRAYSGPICEPSRAQLLTGRYANRLWFARDQESTDGSMGANNNHGQSRISGVDETLNLPTVLGLEGYVTGMVGKWHLTGDATGELGCGDLGTVINAQDYAVCRDLVYDEGFQYVEAFYPTNVKPGGSNTQFTHNNEWLVQEARRFIDETETDAAPFFLYFSTTITHATEELPDLLIEFDTTGTPWGYFDADEAPNAAALGMTERADIRQNAIDFVAQKLGREVDLEDSSDMAYVGHVAGTMWVETTVQAVVDYLEVKGIKDETIIFFCNDHGVAGKSSLYEHGIRYFQSVRYPPLFGTNGYVLPSDFIVSSVDTAAVLFAVTGVELETYHSDYVLDGTNWLPDVQTYVDDTDAGIETDYDTNPPACCEQRFQDFEYSHVVIQKKYKYLFRADCADGAPVRNYPNVNDPEQLYNLEADNVEQVNLVDSDAVHVVNALDDMRTEMTDYMRNVVCFNVPKPRCVVPPAECE